MLVPATCRSATCSGTYLYLSLSDVFMNYTDLYMLRGRGKIICTSACTPEAIFGHPLYNFGRGGCMKHEACSQVVAIQRLNAIDNQ